MDGHISAPAADVVRGVLVELVPVALGLMAVHRLHAQLLHPLPEGGERLFWFKRKEQKLLGLKTHVDRHETFHLVAVKAEGEGSAGTTEDGRHDVHLGGQVMDAGQVSLLQLQVSAPLHQEVLRHVRQLVSAPLQPPARGLKSSAEIFVQIFGQRHPLEVKTGVELTDYNRSRYLFMWCFAVFNWNFNDLIAFPLAGCLKSARPGLF